MSQIDSGIRFAIQAALRSNSPEFKVGAALMVRGRPVAMGCNKYRKTCPCATNRFSNIHAEVNCLGRVPYSTLKQGRLFVVRVTPGGRISMARPCIGCQQMLRQMPISVVYYTNTEGQLIAEDFRG